MPHTNRQERAERFRQSQRGAPPSVQPAQQDVSIGRRQSSIKNKIRSLQRLLAKKELPEETLAEKRAELRELQGKTQEQRRLRRIPENAERYKMVKFFERRKVVRKIKQLQRRIQEQGEGEEDLEAELQRWHVRLLYIRHFPMTGKYISLFRRREDEDEWTRRKRDEVLERAREILCAKMESMGGEIPKFVEGEEDEGQDFSAEIVAAGRTHPQQESKQSLAARAAKQALPQAFRKEQEEKKEERRKRKEARQAWSEGRGPRLAQEEMRNEKEKKEEEEGAFAQDDFFAGGADEEEEEEDGAQGGAGGEEAAVLETFRHERKPWTSDVEDGRRRGKPQQHSRRQRRGAAEVASDEEGGSAPPRKRQAPNKKEEEAQGFKKKAKKPLPLHPSMAMRKKEVIPPASGTTGQARIHKVFD